MNRSSFTHCNPAALLNEVGGDAATFRMLADVFFRESRNKFAALKLAAQADDMPALGAHSHALKGTVGPLAPARLLQMLQILEDECHQQRCRCGPSRLAALHSELSAVAAELRQFMGKL